MNGQVGLDSKGLVSQAGFRPAHRPAASTAYKVGCLPTAASRSYAAAVDHNGWIGGLL